MSLNAMEANWNRASLKERNLLENDYGKSFDCTEENFRKVISENIEIMKENLELYRKLIDLNNELSELYEKVLHLEEIELSVLSVVR